VTGYFLDELLSMNILDIVHPDFKAAIRARSQKRRRGDKAIERCELKIIAKGGRKSGWTRRRRSRLSQGAPPDYWP
jgi:PAS domain S-box-containing protein